MKLSKRANDLLSTPKHHHPISKCEITFGEFAFIVEETDKKLTVSHGTFVSATDLNEKIIVTIVSEAMSILLLKRTLDRLFQLSFKEFESFLSDDHEVEAFDSDTRILFEQAFNKSKVAILIAYIQQIPNIKNWLQDLSFIGKNRLINNIFEVILSRAQQEGNYRFELFEHEFVYFYKNPKVKNSIVEEALEHFLRAQLEESIKLVAVEV